MKNIRSELSNKNLKEEQRIKLEEKMKSQKSIISNLRISRDILPKVPSINLVSKYCKCISFSNPELGRFNNRWISVFVSFVRITNFYEQNLKHIIDPHLYKFKCPVSYENREVLISQNSYLDINSFSFVILDWVFYFFSSDFQKNMETEAFDGSAIVSRLCILIFVLMNEPNSTRVFLSQNGSFDNWKVDLNLLFKSLTPCNTFKQIFIELRDVMKEFKGFIDINENTFYQKIFRGHSLLFLSKIEEILKDYLSLLYVSVSSRNLKINDGTNMNKMII